MPSRLIAGGQRPPGAASKTLHTAPAGRWPAAVAFVLLLLVGSASQAAPKVNSFFPAGAQRGASTEVTASGEFPKWPVQVWSDHPGVTATAEKAKGKLKIAVAADATPGIAWLRIYDAEGAAALRPFIVGQLPEVVEKEPNQDPTKPQSIDPQVVVNGRLGKSGDVDGYAFLLKQGQTVVASLVGNTTLGSPMDSVMQLCELLERPTGEGQNTQAEAFVLEQNHDAIGLDPQLVFTAPRDGKYLVRLFAFPEDPNSTIAFAGGEAFLYRLTVTTGGFVDHALPLAVQQNQSADVALAGWNLPPTANRLSLPPATISSEGLAPPDDASLVAFQADAAGNAVLAVVEQACILAAESSDPATPQEVELPVVISGRLEAERDVDCFRFAAKKSQKITLTVSSRDLGLPVDALLAVLDDTGKQLAEVDDSAKQRDPQLVFTPPADGHYRAVIRDLSHRGGPRFAYRLTISPPRPDFSLALAAESFTLAAGKPLEIPVTVTRRDGFAQPVEIRAVALPAGITAEVVTSAPKGDTAKAVKLVLKADPEATLPISGPLRIEGRASGEPALVRSARFPLTAPSKGQHTAVWVTATK